MTNRPTTDFAVVVIGRNEGERLRACLKSVLRVTRNVVYADSASSDGSAQLARSMGVTVVQVDTSRPLNAARGRNSGFAVVREKFPNCTFVQFLDGDCRLDPDWCRVATEFLQSRTGAAIACGRRFEARPAASIYNRLADQEWNTPIGPAQSCGGDAMMRVDAFEEIGGFNPGLMASEEPELCARLRHRGWEIWRLDALMSEHDAQILSFRQWWKRTTRSGYGYAQAWFATRGLAERVNEKLLRSAMFWVIGVPAAIVLITIASNQLSTLILLPAAYAIQILRLAFRKSRGSPGALKISALLMLAKVAELLGAMRAVSASSNPVIIDYKEPTARRSSTP